NFLGAIKDFLWQSGKARDLDAVALIGATGDDFAQKNDLLIPFAYHDIQIADAFAILGEFRQLVIVRGEQCARFDLVVEKLCDAPCDGEPVEGGRAATDLV